MSSRRAGVRLSLAGKGGMAGADGVPHIKEKTT